MSMTVNIREAKANFSKLLAQVLNGEDIIITKAGTPVAQLVPFTEKPPRRMPGTAIGKLLFAADFDAPLPDNVLETFEQ